MMRDLRHQLKYRATAAFATDGRDTEKIPRTVPYDARGIFAVAAIGLRTETVKRLQRLALQLKYRAALIRATQ